uniref:Adrenodoxin, mitochondrial n=1 Tax=Cacopsylla melanoneura TaxID=428564 RepID=A0A8D8M3Y6_9HEMI
MFEKLNLINMNANIWKVILSKSVAPQTRKIYSSVIPLCIRTFSSKADEIKVTFQKFNGEQVTVSGKEGDSLLDVVVNKNLDFDGFGACEGTLTCSTCHVILKQEDYDKLPSKPTDEELDMLDLAYDLTDTSRLGCQIILSKDLDGLTVKVPATVNDARS